MNINTTDIELLKKTIIAASERAIQSHRILEEKVTLLTAEVDHKKQLLDSILQSIDVGVVFFDGDGIIRLINHVAEKLLNVTAEGVVGGSSIKAVIEDEVITPENGKPFFAIVSRSDVRDGSGCTIGQVLIFKDISRLKQLEEENERNRRLTSMGELVLRIAHEIRNPLGSIELFASLLSSDLRGTDHGDYANRISNSVRMLVNALDNMLRFSKDLKPRLEPVNLNDIVAEIGREFSELFSHDRIVFDLGFDAPLIVNVDRGLMRQALMNIMLNAVQSMPDGGKISVKIARRESGREVELSVRDTGVGMDEETKAKIFEPFYSTKDRGTGLGMSITASIIKAHKGTVRVVSELGGGSEFVITLPEGKGGL
ncbi:MAG: PAS domain-containing protein [Nitrospirae bacterium]|nr:MAG: PAS domain-containing protein [Nitrospirota bacterium]